MEKAMKTDHELLELAAKAAGNGAEWYAGLGMCIDNGLAMPRQWNPLTDDGDLFRLAVKLRIRYALIGNKVSAIAPVVGQFDEYLNDDELYVTRRVVVRAAAAMQEANEQHA
jgi:hypothetical protein